MGLDDYVSDIDAYAKSNAPIFNISDCQFVNPGLELCSSSDGFDGARKLHQEPVAGVLHDAAAVFGNRWVNTVRQESGQFSVGRLFVIVHQPRVASHVGGQYRRQPPLTRSGRSCTMPAIQPGRDLYNGSLGMAIPANVAILRTSDGGRAALQARPTSLHAGDAYFFHGQMQASPKMPLVLGMFLRRADMDRAMRIENQQRLWTLR